MENSNLNRSFCLERLGDKQDVTERPEGKKKKARQHRNWLHELHKSDLSRLQKVVGVLQKTESFCWTTKNMFLPIRDDIREVLRKLDILRCLILTWYFYDMSSLITNDYHCWQFPAFKPLLSKFEQNSFIASLCDHGWNMDPPLYSGITWRVKTVG